ncbi:hypothetical protein A2865_03785 [Candidatus Woesebacteria bacterium RIFCSPHIGHO2_01_FULL_39_17]|uniref:Probable 2-phosphosulfolactate phosphatase n=2 Tax=Candidatus Woeseibacteriota TaxID=1752722 RepID=A0A0G0NF62_9BACT|nr:MAG: 2-phosphosulfolactate phosphatase [Microgenomates group bacterium GW2011_GWC1_38_12]KKR14103.1 MAG: hypothetical protein UT40_C0005G0032 [Candidatus Woesebacteria bacterium GW2011_GWA1_39_21b]OGM23548.1 MAG: hypothetical protein A2865_03785 [Candidatus Woesebacteria bacterium RIFCSPHIGHO2_01_FULL_39_17]OGM62993.1 MAG: hypothetical protein A3A52_03310 [Candidatus Woesebacteria bacterium RIFCSPLOWO2_01_FULL_39_14]
MVEKMEIKILYTTEAAKNAIGIAVIIDVLRACTTIPILFDKGAVEIIPVKTPDEALTYEKEGFVLVGEGEHGHAHDAFHHINSPSEVVSENFTGKKIVLRSNNATQSILDATKAQDIIMASFVNLDAVVEYIRKSKPNVVSLVALGRLGERGLEDDECAEAIKSALEGKAYDFEDMRKRVSVCDCAVLVRDTLGKPKDVEVALEVNSYPVVPKVYSEGDIKVIRPV